MSLKLLLITTLVIHLYGCNQKHDIMEARDDDYLIIKIKDIEIKVEVAKSKDKRKMGLMFRNNLSKGTGMLFVYNSERTGGFWMKNMQFPLDIFFIDSNYKVVDIKRNFSPCFEEPCTGYRPTSTYQYVLEVNSGTASKHRINIGNSVTVN
ncbi:MAG: DUF192 domain-containing protein [Nitrospinae bacterium]|nr:DUF192 domain-containing protein [Nitrospinota bacterium]